MVSMPASIPTLDSTAAVLASLGLQGVDAAQLLLALSLSPRGKTGSVMGTLNGIGSLAAIGHGCAGTHLCDRRADTAVGLLHCGAVLFVIAGLLVLRIPPSPVPRTRCLPGCYSRGNTGSITS